MLYEKFFSEVKRIQQKNRSKKFNDIVKHLFHGTRANNPELIYSSEDGFDMRFSKKGLYGYGNYFSKTSQYSH